MRKNLMLLSLFVASTFASSVVGAADKAPQNEASTAPGKNRDDYVLIKIWVPKNALPIVAPNSVEESSGKLSAKEGSTFRKVLGGYVKSELPFNCVKTMTRHCENICDAWPFKCRNICWTYPEVTCL